MKTLGDPECMAEIVRRLRGVHPGSVGRWGRMSAHEMICHLSDGCLMATGEKRASGPAVPVPRTLLKWFALYVPIRWPPGIPTSPEIDQRCGGTKPADFAADVARLELLLHAMATRTEDAAWARHPVFGRMSRAAWLRWGYLHTDHHLRQFGA